ncbi:MAG: hypothetical protein EXR54_03185 [Dehalococcoidia bacterium]|nr:hypothetical protein [Dehalococcoidia bacterium]MSQ16560.1 hypothetical protein [Dehalococcoidia bacterium]
MSTHMSSHITLKEFQVLARRAGLELTLDELEALLPLYREFTQQLAMLHDPSLPLEEPVMVFPAAWHQR